MLEQNPPLCVNKRTRRFWALIDPQDGTLHCVNVSAEFSPREGHDEVALYTSEATAARAAAFRLLNEEWKLELCEVVVRRKA